MNTHPFQKVYNQLNPSQRKAVDTIDGPVMIIAGPGTGKTQTISTRIANILQKTDTPPDAILALTFTESAAKNMRQRLTSIIGHTAYYVNISTFHSFCTDVIRNHPDEFFISAEAEPLSDLEKIQILQQILDHHHFEKLKPTNFPYFYIREIIRKLQNLKREGITTKAFERILEEEETLFEEDKEDLTKTEASTRQKNLHKNQELLTIYQNYQDEIAKRHRFDYEDMINFVVQKFQNNEDFLRSYQERFHYLMADEYQDTNSAQNNLLHLLASFWGEEANIFTVGDPNQSIYRFQGASLENVLDFTRYYQKAKIISLTQNYRSSQNILDASFSLISENVKHEKEILKNIELKLKSNQQYPENKIKTVPLPSQTVEEYFIVQQVKKLIQEEMNPEEIAILYRNNADSGELADLLNKESVNYNIEGGIDILSDPTIKKILNLLLLIENSKHQTDDLSLFTVLHYEFLDFDSTDILKLSRQAAEARTHLVEVINSPDFGKNASPNISTPEKFTNFLKQLAKWQELDATKTFSEFFEIVIKESDYMNWILDQKDRVEKLNRLNSLFREIKRLNRADHNLNLTKFLKCLELMRENYLKIEEEDLDLSQNAITLSTVHKAKGKEWEHVFIVKAIDGKWGNTKRRELIKLPSGILKNTDLTQIEKNAEERRLFYVALTRAKKEVTITYAETNNDSGRKKENVPTMFLCEINDQYIKTEKNTELDSEKILTSIFTLPEIKESTLSEQETKFLKKLVEKFRLSPTALETYLQCPYKFKLNNLIKLPRAKAIHFAFGSAVHRALELFYQKFNKTKTLPMKMFLSVEFENALKKEVLTEKERQAQLAKGKKMLDLYYDHYAETFTPALITEKFFGYGYSKTYLGNIPLTGKVDRIDIVNEEEKTIRVVDYKTGKPKTRNFIEGKTATSTGGYKRQLVFYKLLAELDYNFPLKVVETELDFVEANSYGKFKKEKFIIEREEVEELKSSIRENFAKIKKLEFAKTTEYKNCQKCEFLDHCWEEGLPQER